MAVIISRRSSYCPNFATALIRGIDLDGISQGAHPDLTLLKVMDQIESVTDGATQPVEGVDDDGISLAGLLESEPIRGESGFLVDVDVFIRNTLLYGARRSDGRGLVLRWKPGRNQYP